MEIVGFAELESMYQKIARWEGHNEVSGPETYLKKHIGVYRIAGYNFRITSMYPSVQRYCRDYRTDGEPDFYVETTPEDLVYERERSPQAEGALRADTSSRADTATRAEGALRADTSSRADTATRADMSHQTDAAKNPREHPCSDAYMEELAVYRKIAEILPERDTFLFHGSAIAVDGQAYIFTAKSGTGKSTHARLWRELLGDRAVMINDDKPLIHVGDDQVTVFGTPWNGKHRLGINTEATLRAVCLIEQSKENWIRPITNKEAMTVLIRQTYRPSDAAKMARTLALIDKMSRNIKLYRLGCNMDQTAAELSYHTMKPDLS